RCELAAPRCAEAIRGRALPPGAVDLTVDRGRQLRHVLALARERLAKLLQLPHLCADGRHRTPPRSWCTGLLSHHNIVRPKRRMGTVYIDLACVAPASSRVSLERDPTRAGPPDTQVRRPHCGRRPCRLRRRVRRRLLDGAVLARGHADAR